MNTVERVLGVVLLGLGGLLIIVSLADLLLRLILALFGLWIANYGLKMMGQPSLFFWVSRAIAYRRFF